MQIFLICEIHIIVQIIDALHTYMNLFPGSWQSIINFFFCERLESECFNIVGPYRASIVAQNSHRQCLNDWMWLCSNKILLEKAGNDHRISFMSYNLQGPVYNFPCEIDK